jgi:hypothetical protein
MGTCTSIDQPVGIEPHNPAFGSGNKIEYLWVDGKVGDEVFALTNRWIERKRRKGNGIREIQSLPRLRFAECASFSFAECGRKGPN